MDVKFKQWDCVAVGGRYQNGRRAIELIDGKDYEPVATASVNIVNQEQHEDAIFVPNYKYPGMVMALAKAGIIEGFPLKTVKAGFVEVNEYKLTPEAIEKLWKSEDSN